MPPPCVDCGQTMTHLPGCPERAYNEEVARRAEAIRVEAEAEAQRRREQALREVQAQFRMNMQRENELTRLLIDKAVRPPVVIDEGRPVMIRVGLPSAQHRAFSVAAKHIIEIDQPVYGTGNEVRFGCRCGWAVSQAYCADLSPADIRGMLDAHLAGGQVGPTQAKFAFPIPFKVACFNCCSMPEKKVNVIQRRILEACCDGEVRIMPRRRIVLGEED